MARPPWTHLGWRNYAFEELIKYPLIPALPTADNVRTALELLAGSGGIFWLGKFASNHAALAYIVANGLDVAGLPQTSQAYWNTTLDCLRIWDGTIWRGRPWVEASGKTLHVFAAMGSDAGGTGTAGDPYATINQAMQDVAFFRDPTGAETWEIVLHDLAYTLGTGGAGYTIDAGHPQSHPVVIRPSGSSLATAWTGAIDNPGGVLRDQWSDVAAGAHGRRVQVTGAGWTAGAVNGGIGGWMRHRVTVTAAANPAIVGATGWVLDNGTDWVQFDLDYDAYTGDGGAGLSDGDTIQIANVRTELSVDGGDGELILRGPVQLQGVDVRAGSIVVEHDARPIFRESTMSSETGRPPLTLFQCAPGSRTVFQGCNCFATFLQEPNSAIVFDGDPNDVGIPNTTHNIQWLPQAGPSSLALIGRNSWSNWGNLPCTLSPGTDILFDDPEADHATGYYLRLYGLENFLVDSEYATRPFRWTFPDCAGDAGNSLFWVDGGVAPASQGGRILFPVACAVYNITATNYCRDDAGNPWYGDEAYDFEILGTGNYERLLTEPHDWVGDGSTPYVAALVGRNESMAFAVGVDLIGYGGLRVPPRYVPGTDLEFEFQYVTEDPASGHYCVVNVGTGLYRPGTDDASAEPPANAHNDNTNLVPVSSGAGVLEDSQRFTMSTGGQVNAIDLAEGQLLSIRLEREGTNGSDDCTGTLWVLLNSIRVWNVGL